jgi:hypothetical protein
MELDIWVGTYKVRVFPWIDGKRIYCNVRYYKPGQSIEKEPAWDKTVYITDNAAGRNLLFNFTDSLIENIGLMRIANGEEVTLTA